MVAPWPGVRPVWSRRVRVPSTAAASAAGSSHVWHLLDNGAELAERGVRPAGTLLCVHGNPTWSYLWRGLVSAASDAATPWRVVAVDQLDMGYSERTGTFRRLDDRITDLSDLTDALGLVGPVVTVGHDWGGIISLGWALRHPEVLHGVVLTNTAVHPAGFSLPPALRLALHPAVHGWGTTTTPAFLRVTHALAQPPLSEDVRRAFMVPYTTSDRRAGVGNFVADIPAGPSHPSWRTLEDVSSGVRDLNVPALLMWGPRDPVFSDRYLRDLITRLPHADVHRFEGAGHLLPEDRDVAAPILQWLAHLPAVPEGAQDAQWAPGLSSAFRDGGAPGPAFRPMLAELDDRRNDDGRAVVDMLSPTSADREPTALSWAELAERVDALARGLASIGVSAGDRISLLVPPGIDLTCLMYACLRLGAVVVVADAGLGAAGLGRAIKGAGPKYLVGIERALAGARAFGWPGLRISATRLGPVRHRLLDVAHTLPDLVAAGAAAGSDEPFAAVDADADAAVLFTSGSTGPAKGVVYTHRQLAAMRDTMRETYGIAAGSALVAGFAPFALLGPALGATSVTPAMDVTAPGTLTARALAAAASTIDATVVFASPAALVNVDATASALDDAGRRTLAGVSLLLSAGAPIPEPLLDRIQRLVPSAALHTPYGMTEALPVTDIDYAGIRAAGSGNGVCVGTPVSGARVAVAPLSVDGTPSDAASVEPWITGEILIDAPHVKDRYDRLWITEQQSASLHGWHRTGDVGHFDVEGRLWVEGRLAHILTTPGGVRTPVAAELAAASSPGAGRSAVVGVGPTGAQVAVAVLETLPPSKSPGRAPERLVASVRDSVRDSTGIEVAAVLVVPRLPTDVRHNSKIDRTAVAAWAETTLAGGKAHAL